MRPGGRIQAAIEIIEEILNRHRPASAALSDWGKAHRFAGSGDRSAIGTLVYDVLRQRNSLGAQMQADTPRALVLAASPASFAMTANDIAAVVDGSQHAPKQISEAEREGIFRDVPKNLPTHIAGDFPEWLTPSLTRAFGDNVEAEGRAMAVRAPVDMRVNTLEADRETVLEELTHFKPSPTQWSPFGVRIAPPAAGKRQANVEAEAAHGKGWFEVQDEGSQIAALMVGAKPTDTVLDLCAGAGGKTLALAAIMQNEGELAAYDASKIQLRPLFDRARRAGVTNIDVLRAGEDAALKALGPTFDRVLVDAPCTGSGTWRRRPDSKWRLKQRNIAQRQSEQKKVLDLAAHIVNPGGTLVYVTCSVLPEENGDQVAWFLEQFPDFSVVPYREQWKAVLPDDVPAPVSADGSSETLLLTPAQHQTDGFFIAVLRRKT
ncbi:MAG: RsmB/NOP family class I SAM-dependent RNA methyltransferase [Hyphomicrobiaceae bacterium]